MAQRHEDDGLAVLAVNVWDEDEALLQRFARKEKLGHQILLNGSEVREKFGVENAGVPLTLWIDRDGNVVDAELGFYGPGPVEAKTDRLLGAG